MFFCWKRLQNGGKNQRQMELKTRKSTHKSKSNLKNGNGYKQKHDSEEDDDDDFENSSGKPTAKIAYGAGPEEYEEEPDALTIHIEGSKINPAELRAPSLAVSIYGTGAAGNFQQFFHWVDIYYSTEEEMEFAYHYNKRIVISQSGGSVW